MNPSEELLIQSSKDNRKAHYELYRICFSFILAICSRYYINKDDRMSALNMIFFKVVINLKQYLNKNKNVPFELWVRRIAINYIIDEFRKNKNYRERIELQENYNDNKSDEKEDLPVVTEKIKVAIEELPDVSRTVFNLYVIDGYKHEEIANLLGISANTSKVHLHRAKNKLRELLSADNDLKMVL